MLVEFGVASTSVHSKSTYTNLLLLEAERTLSLIVCPIFQNDLDPLKGCTFNPEYPAIPAHDSSEHAASMP